MASREYDVDDTRAETHVTGSRVALRVPSGLPMFKPPKTGTFRLEFIPYLVTESIRKYPPELRFSSPGKWYPERTYFVHGGIGIDNAMVCCRWKTFGNPCFICDVRARLAKSPHKEDTERAYSLKSKERQLFLVIKRNDRSGELDGEIELWDIANWNWGKQLDAYIEGADPEDRDAYKRYYHPTRGFTVKLNGTEENMGGGGTGKYSKYAVHEFKIRREPLPDDLFDHGYDLDSMIREMDYESMKKAYLGTDDSDNGETTADDEIPNKPPTRRVYGGGGSDNGGTPPKPVSPPSVERKPEPAPVPIPPPKPVPVATIAPKTVQLASLDRVSFEWRGGKHTGVIESVNTETSTVVVKFPAREKPLTLDFDEVTLLEADSTFDLKNPSPDVTLPEPIPDAHSPIPTAIAPPKPAKRSWDDDGDDGRVMKPRPAAPTDPESPAPKKRGR